MTDTVQNKVSFRNYLKILLNNPVVVALFTIVIILILVSMYYGIWFGITWGLCLNDKFRREQSLAGCAGFFGFIFSVAIIPVIFVSIIAFVWLVMLFNWLYDGFKKFITDIRTLQDSRNVEQIIPEVIISNED